MSYVIVLFLENLLRSQPWTSISVNGCFFLFFLWTSVSNLDRFGVVRSKGVILWSGVVTLGHNVVMWVKEWVRWGH